MFLFHSSLIDRIRAAAVAQGNGANPPGTAPVQLVVTSDGAKNGGRKTYSKTLGKGGWPQQDPLHDPPMQIEAFRQPAVGTD